MKQVPILKENKLVLCLFCPKTHLCVVVDQDYSWIGRQEQPRKKNIRTNWDNYGHSETTAGKL